MFAFFERFIDPFQPYDDQKPIPNRIGAFFRMFLWPARWVILLSLTLGGIAAALDLLLIDFAGRLVDMMEGTPASEFWATHRGEILTMVVIALIAYPAVAIVDSLVRNQAYLTPMACLIRWRTHRHVMRQSLSFFQNDFAGRIAQKIIQTGPAVADSFYGVSDALWYAVIYIIGAFVLIGAMDPLLLIPMSLWLIAYIGLAWWVIPRIGVAAKHMSEARSQLTGRIVDSYTNMQTVKLFAHTEHEDEYAREGLQATLDTFRVQMRVFSIMDMGLTLLNVLLIGSVVGVGAWLWSMGQVTTGAIAAAAALVLRLNAMTGWIMWMLANLFQNIGVTMEGMETISRPRDVVDAEGAEALELNQGEIVFDHTRFMYGADKGGLKDVHLTIKPGERVGLIGRSGAGKSTLVNAMLRFYDVEGGRILIDGQDVSKVRQASLRGHIAVVTQDTALLHRSVRDNIRYGAPDASEAAIVEAAEKAQAHDFIQDLADPEGREGYDAHVGERGVKLSGGQRQRVAIARAILKDAPILVLDEATSALDSEVEAEIQEQLYELMEGKTVIAIAHRLSTVARMDRLVVMDQGRIVEEGTHAELLAKGGLYAGFWARQSGGFLGADSEAEAPEAAAE